MLGDQPQKLTTDACVIFQLYFYKNLFELEAGSKIINDEFLTQKKNSWDIAQQNIFTK